MSSPTPNEATALSRGSCQAIGTDAVSPSICVARSKLTTSMPDFRARRVGSLATVPANTTRLLSAPMMKSPIGVGSWSWGESVRNTIRRGYLRLPDRRFPPRPDGAALRSSSCGAPMFLVCPPRCARQPAVESHGAGDRRRGVLWCVRPTDALGGTSGIRRLVAESETPNGSGRPSRCGRLAAPECSTRRCAP